MIDCYDCYDLTEPAQQFEMAEPPADIRAETLKLESELALCHVLPDNHALVHAFCAARDAYIQWLPNGNRDNPQRDTAAEVTEAKAIWSGIGFWITRHLGPIPEEALSTTAWNHIAQPLHECAADPFHYLVSEHLRANST